MNSTCRLLGVAALLLAAPPLAGADDGKSGNPVFPGHYADPEGTIFGNSYWIYPTYFTPYDEQTFLDAFSSPDLVTWTKHPRILDTSAIRWARRAIWAPSVVAKGGKYYLFFGANDIQNDDEVEGLCVAVADNPAGPFQDHLGKPLVDKFHHGAQPKAPSCSSAAASTISCGPRGAGPAPTTASPTPSPTPPSAPSGAS